MSSDGHSETDRVVIDLDEAEEVASLLEAFYHYTGENAYRVTEREAARLAYAIRSRAGIEDNPNLLEKYDYDG